MNSENQILLEEIIRLKRENPQWFEVLQRAAELSDDELKEVVESITALIESKKGNSSNEIHEV